MTVRAHGDQTARVRDRCVPRFLWQFEQEERIVPDYSEMSAMQALPELEANFCKARTTTCPISITLRQMAEKQKEKY